MMATMAAEQEIRDHAAQADIRIDGSRPWDIRVHDDRFYERVLSGGSLALGESYMDGWWDCDRIDVAVCRMLQADIPCRRHSHAQNDLQHRRRQAGAAFRRL